MALLARFRYHQGIQGIDSSLCGTCFSIPKGSSVLPSRGPCVVVSAVLQRALWRLASGGQMKPVKGQPASGRREQKQMWRQAACGSAQERAEWRDLWAVSVDVAGSLCCYYDREARS